jgi:hypothetical protein
VTPRIVKSILSKDPIWYVVTRYSLKDGIDSETGEKTQYLVAQRKYDVTDQMKAILAKEQP